MVHAEITHLIREEERTKQTRSSSLLLSAMGKLLRAKICIGEKGGSGQEVREGDPWSEPHLICRENGEVAMVGVELDGEVGSWWLGLSAGSNECRGSKISYKETFGVA
jgi:hypothetical protein